MRGERPGWLPQRLLGVVGSPQQPLPSSAEPFVFEDRYRSHRQISGFITQLDTKIASFHLNPKNERKVRSAAIKAYIRTTSKILPLITDAVRAIDHLPELSENNTTPGHSNTPEVYHGRDAVLLYAARKASLMGGDRHTARPTISYIVSSSSLMNDSFLPRTETINPESDFAQYLAENSVPVDAYHIDTAYYGKSIEKILSFLSHGRLSAAELNRRIKMMRSWDPERGLDMTSWGHEMELEYLVTEASTSPTQFRRGRSGKLIPDIHYRSPKAEIVYWAQRQAVVRAFLPKAAETMPEPVKPISVSHS